MLPPTSLRKAGSVAARVLCGACLAAAVAAPSSLAAQGFDNIPRTPGELLSGEASIAWAQGRTAIIAWHGDRIVSVPEPPGSQPGADVQIRVVDISDLDVLAAEDDAWLEANGYISRIPATAFGFNAHGYFHTGPYLYIGPHCATASIGPCGGGQTSVWADSVFIAPPGDPRTRVGTSPLVRASIESEVGLPIGGINRSGAQSPWGAEQFWSYDSVSGDTFLAVRRSIAEYIYDWGNGGATNGPAITATWDHLGQTGVIGFPFIIGNILLYASDQTGTGVAAYDISDPTNPVLLDVLKEENPGGYWPEVYGHYIFFPRRDGEGGAGSAAGFMVVDFSDPTDLRVVADVNLPGSNQYVTFQDEFAFMNNYKVDMRTFEVALELDTSAPGVDASQFALPVGNLVVTGGYGSDGPGLRVWAHQAEPDTRAPYVLYHIPRPDQANYSVHCPIVLSIPETLRTETMVDGQSIIVRPVGGAPIPTWHSFGQGKLLTITPHQPLQPDTTYEVELTSAIEDAAGNGLEPYTFRFSTGGELNGGNQPPAIGDIVAAPEIALPGEEVLVSWSGDDPEGGAVEFRVDFGDGTPRTDWGTDTSAAHTYPDAGHYQVSVQARDAQGAVSARSRLVTVAPLPAAPGSTASAMLALDDATRRLLVVNPDNDTVSAIDADSLEKLWEAPVGAHPKGVAIAGGLAWVAARDGDTLDVLALADGALLHSLPLGHGSRPVGVAATPNGASVLVTCEGDGTLRRFSVAAIAQDASLALGPSPRAIAVTHDGARALVTRFISPEHHGEVYDVSLAGGMSLTRVIRLARDRSTDGSASSRGVPNYLAGIRVAPDGQHAWVVGKKDNTTRGAFFSPALPLGQDNTVRAQLCVIDLVADAENVALRLDIDNADSPTSIDFSPRGDHAFIALQGINRIAVVDVLDFMKPESDGAVRSRWDTGLAPQSILLDPATGRVFTADFMDRTVTVQEAAGFLSAGAINFPRVSVPVVEHERLHDEVLLGKQIFYNADDPRMSPEGYISCATCHIDGSHDGRTWDFTNRGEGFRNTTDLRGRSGTWHGLVHWSANFDEIQDFENDIRNDFGGAGFMDDADFISLADTMGAPKAGQSVDLDALAAYVSSLGTASLPRSPARAEDGSLTEAAQRGQALFSANNCASCHNPANDYTDRLQHDVGTLKASSGARLGAALTAIDTPTLLGLHDTAPYLHDGSGATLEEVFTIAGGRMEQAEHGARSGNANVDGVPWFAMKEWHNGEFVVFNGEGSVTWDDVQSSAAGDGYVEVRYNVSYWFANLGVRVNGAAPVVTNLAQTGNVPNWLPNEWRTVRVPVTFAAGVNTVEITGGTGGGELKVDDVLFVTPDDLAAASAHVRGFSEGDLADIAAYLRSLDGTNAALPVLAITRGGLVAPGGVDVLEFPEGETTALAAYTIANNGAGPLNLGNFRIEGAALVSLATHSAPNVLPGEATQLALEVPASAVGQVVTIRGWTDSGGAWAEATWQLDVQPAASSRVEEALRIAY